SLRVPLEAGAQGPGKRQGPAGTPQGDPELFQRLRALRGKLSQAQNVPVYVIFSNATLEAMAACQPATPAVLLDVPGLGQAKLRPYGRACLEEIARWKRETEKKGQPPA